MKILTGLSIFLSLSLMACVSAQKAEPLVTAESEPYVSPLQAYLEPTLTEPLPQFEDYRSYKFNDDIATAHEPQRNAYDKMGYVETVFQNEYYVFIHFLLLCRDAHESAYRAFDSSRMKPLGFRAISWSLSDQSGMVVLDQNGFGEIQTRAKKSLQKERLKLRSENEVLYVRAGDIGRIATPPDWCGH